MPPAPDRNTHGAIVSLPRAANSAGETWHLFARPEHSAYAADPGPGGTVAEEGIVWRASAEVAARSHTSRFMSAHGIERYDELVRRSSTDPEWFWPAAISHLGIPFLEPYQTVRDLSRGKPFGQWFPDGRVNLSAMCVDRWASEAPERIALEAAREDGQRRSLTYAELLDAVSRTAGWLESQGMRPGDAAACFLPMCAEAAIALLAVARVGGLFVPIFSGFGPEAIAARLGDANPKFLFTADGFRRRGVVLPMKETADAAIELACPSAKVIVVPYTGRADTPWRDDRDVAWHEVAGFATPTPPRPIPCEEPLLLGYTSGTTGKPKGVVLPHGGASIKMIQEGAFQLDYQTDDVACWVTDMGWIMGPWLLIAGLGNGSTVALLDGAPDFPDPGALWRWVDELKITALGISPTLVRALQSHGDAFLGGTSRASLRTFGATGEAWNPSPWWWLFDEVGRRRLPIINMSGGTEVGACFLSANILQGLKPCSVGGPSLGMPVDVFDESGHSVREQVGELVCRDHWPGATRGFWGDPQRYLDTYWDRWPDVWVHGDWATVDSDGFWFLHGRSDDTLNVAGKRLGPSEIEDAAVAHPGVAMAAAIGVPDARKGEAIVAYVVPTPGVSPDAALLAEVEESIVEVVGRAFRPKCVLAARDLPRTRSQKIMRRVIKALALGQPPGDVSSLENPDALSEIEPLSSDG